MTNKRVAIVDDDPAILDSLRLILEIEGYQVETADRGEDIPKVLELNPDLLLLDIWMAGQDGRDICRAIKSDPMTASVPVILVSAARDMAPSARAAGADDFLTKPLLIEVLLKKIERVIRQ